MATKHRSPFIGRDTELERLAESVAGARAGQPSALLISGEAGIGKSRLVAEAQARLLDPGELTFTGQAVDLAAGEIPFGAIGISVRDLIQREGLDAVRRWAGPDTAALAALAPELGEHRSGGTDRVEVIEAFSSLLEQVSRDQLTWWLVEDLQWADVNTRDTVQYVVHLLRAPSRLLVTATLRTHDRPPSDAFAAFHAELVRSPSVARVDLARLDREEVSRQLQALRGEPPSRKLLDRAMTLAEGVPFLTEELVASGLSASGSVDSTVTDLMLARVGALSTDALTLIRATSLADGHARSSLLDQVTGLDTMRMDVAAREAVDVSVLEIDETIDGYRFHHALMREAVDHAILPGERTRWHRRWAEALETAGDVGRHGGMATAAAHHWAQTDDHKRAFTSALLAADWAAEIGAETERAALLTRVLDLWPSIDDAEQQAGRSRDEVFEEAMWAHDLSGSLTGALELVESELQRPEAGVDAVTRRLQRQLVRRWVLEELGRPEAERLETTFGTVLAQAALAPRTPMFVRLVAELVWATEDHERAEQLWPFLEEAIDLADAQGSALDRWNIAGCRASLLRNRGYQDEGADLYLEKLAWVRAEYPVSRVMAWETNAMFLLTAAGRFHEAVEIGLVTIRRLGSPLLARRNWDFVRGTLAEAMIDLGRWEQAEEYLTQTRASQSEGIYLMSFRLLAGLIRARSGDTAEAAALLDATVTELSDPGMRSQAFIDIQVGVLAAELALQQGDLEGARSRLRELWRHPASQGDSQLWRVLVLAARVETDLASAAGSGIGAHEFDQIIAVADDVKGTSAFAAVWTAQVTAERLRAERADSPALWQEVADGWAGNGQVHDQAWALVRLAEAALREGDGATARAALEQAANLGNDIGARPVVEAVLSAARRGRITLDAAASPDGSRPRSVLNRLTPREVDVLRLVAAGQSNEQIGATLFISPKTASVHVSRILAKLGAASRTEASAIAHREGLLADETDLRG